MNYKLEFKDGLVFQNNIQCYFTPINHFLLIIDKLINSYNKTEVVKILKDSTKYDSLIIFEKIYNRKKNQIQIIKEFLEYINGLGMGEILLKNISQNKIIFYQKNISLNKAYINIFGKSPSIYPEEILLGYIQNFLEQLLSKKLKSELTYDSKTRAFYYSITKTDKKKDKEQVQKNYENIIQRKTDIGNLLKKLLINKKIKIEYGYIKVINMYGVLIPYFFFIELTSKFNNEKMKKFLEELGNMQGKNSVDMHKKLFGTKDETKIFYQVVKMSDISGMGKIEILNKNPYKYSIKTNLRNFFSKYYNPEKLKFLEHHFNSICKGVVEFSFNKTTLDKKEKNTINLKILKNTRELTKNEKEISKILNQKSLVLDISGKKSNI